ncbi:C40 family peptidase [Paenibacillus sp. TRM 82003]|nr:C40 family peptidase [Paenibacillus sp. TRM 82003]
MNASGPRRVWPSPGLADDAQAAVRNVISTASTYFGTPYEYGSNRSEPSTFDCSDFTRWVYLYTLGMDLPLDSRSQAEYVRRYSGRAFTNIREARPGDLLFFTAYNGISPENYPSSRDRTITHTGVYIGGDKMIHTASAKTGGVRIDPVFGNHLEYRFVLGGSVLE